MAKRGRKGGHKRAGGRAKGTPNRITLEASLLARDYGEMAIEILVKLMKSKKEPGSVRVSAAKEILDRAYGRSHQSISGLDGKPLSFPNIIVEFLDPPQPIIEIGDSVEHLDVN